MNVAGFMALALLCSLSVALILEGETHDKLIVAQLSSGDMDLQISDKQGATNDDFIAFSGFTMIPNDGTGVFHPIFPGAVVPPARETDGNSGSQQNSPSPKPSLGGATVPEPSIDSSPEGDGPVCFPADVLVETELGFNTRMDQVKVGDRVRVANGQFSTVFMFTHKLRDVAWTFVKLDTEAGMTIRLTTGHYIYVGDRLMAAGAVKVGDTLTLADERRTVVTNVARVSGRGLYNPQTAHGNIVVNGILASTYTRAVQYSTAHALLAPLRALYDRLGLSMTCFDHGADSFVGLFPSGSQTS